MNKLLRIFTRSSFITIFLIPTVLVFPVREIRAEGIGSTSASFLSLPVGAKSASMGEVKSALEGDPFNWIANPATPLNSEGNSFGLFHSQWILNTYYDNAFYRKKLNGLIVIGAGFGYLSSPEIQAYNEIGEPTGSITDNTFRGILGITFIPIRGFSFGLNVNYFQEKLAEWTARGFSTDIGAIYDVPAVPITMGVVLQNLGPEITFLSHREELPLTFRAGLCIHIPAILNLVELSVATDIVRTRYEKSYAEVGGEIVVSKVLSLRAGFVGDDLRESNGFTAGAGVRFSDRLAFDYAWAPYGDLGTFHRIGVFISISD